MTTQIFADYAAFLRREDLTVNGVTQNFADAHPDWNTDRNNRGCWNCSDCSDCSDCSGCSDCSCCSDCYCCSDCSDCSGCSCCSDCSGCSGCFGCSCCSDCSDCSGCSCCSDCSGCSRCSDCSGCSGCSRCSRCSDCSCCSRCSDCSGEFEVIGKRGGVQPSPDVPVIPNIHQRVLDAVSAPGALDMSTWHTCDTTHCRAGWVVQLAGDAGKALEAFHNTPLAAQLIYKASSPIRVSPLRFYDSTDEDALADMRRCAEAEAALAGAAP